MSKVKQIFENCKLVKVERITKNNIRLVFRDEQSHIHYTTFESHLQTIYASKQKLFKEIVRSTNEF